MEVPPTKQTKKDQKTNQIIIIVHLIEYMDI